MTEQLYAISEYPDVKHIYDRTRCTCAPANAPHPSRAHAGVLELF